MVDLERDTLATVPHESNDDGNTARYDHPLADPTLALTAIKQNDITVGKGLLQNAIDTSPTYFEAAVRSLAALDA